MRSEVAPIPDRIGKKIFYESLVLETAIAQLVRCLPGQLQAIAVKVHRSRYRTHFRCSPCTRETWRSEYPLDLVRSSLLHMPRTLN